MKAILGLQPSPLAIQRGDYYDLQNKKQHIGPLRYAGGNPAMVNPAKTYGKSKNNDSINPREMRWLPWNKHISFLE